MASTLKKVGAVLVTLLVLGISAYLLVNIFMPNTYMAITDAMEDTAYRMANWKIDINGDGQYGSADRDQYGGKSEDNASDVLDQNKVEGFKSN